MKCVLKNNAGVSLLELTFASGILAMALSLLFGSLISITLVARINEEKAMANAEILNLLERTRGMSLNELKTIEPPMLDHPGVVRTLSVVCYDAGGDQISLPLESDSDELDDPDLPNPLVVEATMLWTNAKGHVFRSTASTLVAR